MLFEQQMPHLMSYFSLENRFQLPQRNILIVSLGLPNGILQHEKKELQAMVSERKARLSGKRKVIDGGSLISTVEKLNGVTAAASQGGGTSHSRKMGKKTESMQEA